MNINLVSIFLKIVLQQVKYKNNNFKLQLFIIKLKL